ncbi:phosphomannomutase/phosphoglucomutase [Legionella jordanis]|uniref:phosphomannomutase n=1 Tax=Legionella jordanis TaxID=456 RepID=A0A0W0VBC5_9GAMM|nr:phosphomannomutase/phosphoglucomutase [Legionella jordanis]KTD17413.1 phosphomannomutase [Legionella jordanis]RMX01822.1 phosphomannomutase/phosphoglucomutase [Legionella jordanis]RMX15486.1 phosphomannomutase/phosphoglucomutase [Legionella jordanis]VEH11566.1 phosphomannomutase [Legionella jordanis]
MGYVQKEVERSVFRAYDIRGLVGKQLDEDAFYSIGLAIGYRLNELQRDKIYVARDGRLSSEQLAKALQQGLLESGITVLDLGTVATPIMYYATHSQEVDSGLIVTGSHNPSDYNGIKIVLAGKTLVQQDIEKLHETLANRKRLKGQGQYLQMDIIDDYCQRVLKDIQLSRPLKVVVDCGNGVAGPVIPKVIAAMGCEVIPLYCDVDGRFPNHHPDPSVEENLQDLKETVLATQADLGLAFDGDADRLGVVTDKGETIWPDRLLMLYATHVLQHNAGGTIVYDVKCSSHLAEVIKRSGGIARMCPTGHSIVKAVMKQEQAALAGEMSGHLFFKDRWYGFDDALYSACRLLEILSLSSQTVSQQFSKIPNSINTPEIKIPIAEDIKFSFMERFCAEALFPEAELITIDGLRVEFANGWGLLRASNTTPCLVARFEARDQQSLEQIQELFRAQLQRLDSSLSLSF